MRACRLAFAAMALLTLSACATKAPKDYSLFRQSKPKSILVLPPLNESADVNASYSLLTTTTRPIAEMGYYVFPIAMVDQFMKENGLTVAGEMHQAPLAKLRDVFGADAVLYLTVLSYGSKYQVIATNTVVKCRGKLVDARSGATLWEDTTEVVYSGQSGLLEAVVQQVMNKIFDQAHGVAAMASTQMFMAPAQGLLKGPRHPEVGRD